MKAFKVAGYRVELLRVARLGPAIVQQLGDRAVPGGPTHRLQEPRQRLADVGEGCLSVAALVALRHAFDAEAGRADQIEQLAGPAVHELGTELDRAAQLGIVHSVDPAADPVTRLDYEDTVSSRRQRLRRCEARNAGPEHQDVHRGHRRGGLLVAQRVDRIQPRGPARGPDAEEEPDQRAETERDDHRGG